jgi:hypothetical protein
MRRNNLFKDVDMALKNYLKRQKVQAKQILTKAVEDGNIFVAHIAGCGNVYEKPRKPLKTAA